MDNKAPASSLAGEEFFWWDQPLRPRRNEARPVGAQGVDHDLEVKDVGSHHLLAGQASTEDYINCLAKLWGRGPK